MEKNNPDFNPKDNIPQENDIQESNLLSDNNNAKTDNKELKCLRLIDNPPIFSTSCIMIIGICLLGELDMLNANYLSKYFFDYFYRKIKYSK